MKLQNAFTLTLPSLLIPLSMAMASANPVFEKILADLTRDCARTQQLCFLKPAKIERDFGFTYSELMDEYMRRNQLTEADLGNIIPVEEAITNEELTEIITNHLEIFNMPTNEANQAEFNHVLENSPETRQMIQDKTDQINESNVFSVIRGSVVRKSSTETIVQKTESEPNEPAPPKQKSKVKKNKDHQQKQYSKWKKEMSKNKKNRGSTSCYR